MLVSLADDVTLQAGSSSTSRPWLDATLPTEQRLEALMGALKPQQKVAQLQTDAGGGVPELGLPPFTWQVGRRGTAAAVSQPKSCSRCPCQNAAC